MSDDFKRKNTNQNEIVKSLTREASTKKIGGAMSKKKLEPYCV